MKKEYEIDTIRHSQAHLMAQAIKRLFPQEDIQLGVGPVIEHGFYYDIDTTRKISEEDFSAIEKMMKQIIKEKISIDKKVFTREEALQYFGEKSEHRDTLKQELIAAIPSDEEITCYSQAEFTDLCRGPHVENTKDIPPYFKITHVAGAYWRGDEKNKMLQRVYACSFSSKEELRAHLNFLQEAKKRDHRKLGKELNLFHMYPEAPGSPFFLPKGTFVYNALCDFIRQLYKKFDYQEVLTPQILDASLWKTSGHYEHYKENMYFTEIDSREYAIKPMNCPCHMLIFKNQHTSYRDLPLRMADFGRLHRYEKSGSISGITRVRSFCQDDGHIFLALQQIQEEVLQLLKMYFECYQNFEFSRIKVALATRPEKKGGSDETWDQAESALKSALEEACAQGILDEYGLKSGDGAFYGPKIDIQIADALGRYHQLGTIQLDFILPERFDLQFVNQKGEQERPVVIHRALLGSLERFLGVYIEHVAGAFPFWLAPTQVAIVPVNNEHHLSYAQEVHRELQAQGFRSFLDTRNESLGYKTREHQKQKIPYMLVLGDREGEAQTVSARRYGEKQTQSFTREEMLKQFHQENDQGSSW